MTSLIFTKNVYHANQNNPRVCDLKSVVAETSNLYLIKINKGSLKTKSDILKWIEEHWDMAKPILSSMLELKCSDEGENIY